MHGRPIRTSLGSEPYGSALVCTGTKCSIYLKQASAGKTTWHWLFDFMQTKSTMYKLTGFQ